MSLEVYYFLKEQCLQGWFQENKFTIINTSKQSTLFTHPQRTTNKFKHELNLWCKDWVEEVANPMIKCLSNPFCTTWTFYHSDGGGGEEI